MKRIFYLTPGDQPPEGTTAEGFPDGGIVWIGDTWTASGIESHEMSAEEEQTYIDMGEYTKAETKFEISFDEWRDADKLAAKEAKIASKLSKLKTDKEK